MEWSLLGVFYAVLLIIIHTHLPRYLQLIPFKILLVKLLQLIILKLLPINLSLHIHWCLMKHSEIHLFLLPLKNLFHILLDFLNVLNVLEDCVVLLYVLKDYLILWSEIGYEGFCFYFVDFFHEFFVDKSHWVHEVAIWARIFLLFLNNDWFSVD